jgi:SAM-dependent methyltransferase
VARKNLANQPRAVILDHSIYELPFENEFDVAMSIGVIHHLTEPRRAVAQLVKAAKPGGTVLLWVYGKEGHTHLKSMINAVRKVTSRMPLRLLDVLVRPVSFFWWFYMRLAPVKDPYVRLLSKAPFWHIHSILFDQLLPETANYWTRAEALALFTGLPVCKLDAYFCNQCSWTVVAQKQSS